MKSCMWESALEEIRQVYKKIWSENLKKKAEVTSLQWTYEGEKYLDACGTEQFQWVREKNFTFIRFFCHKMPRRLVDMGEPRTFLTTMMENEDCDCRFTWKLRKQDPS
jgi:hypothetical protein